MSLTGPPPLEYAAGANTPFKAVLNAPRGLVLLVTQTLNPPELSSMAQLAPVLRATYPCLPRVGVLVRTATPGAK